jgi:hypothetical protein
MQSGFVIFVDRTDQLMWVEATTSCIRVPFIVSTNEPIDFLYMGHTLQLSVRKVTCITLYLYNIPLQHTGYHLVQIILCAGLETNTSATREI